ncbi:MAG TPA: hypothetical protein VGM88_14145 [Kofleriaceae bacterium]
MTADVAFVFTNPRHHFEMMAPVARELESRGVPTQLVSLAELRGLDSPDGVRAAIPWNVRKRPAARTETEQPSGLVDKARAWKPTELAKRAVWSVLGLRMRQLVGGARVVVVPNDAVFPYIELLGQVRGRGARAVLMQEGIRFPLPDDYEGMPYGSGNVNAVCAWGDGSKEYFVGKKVPPSRIVVTGAPRLDELDPAAWREAGAKLLADKQLAQRPIAFLSNPIEIQGYGEKAVKLEIWKRFLREAAPVVGPRRIPILVKNHLHEDPADFARIAADSPIGDLVSIAGNAPIFAVLAAARAAIVLTSTVGLEALAFGLPLAALEIPGYGFPFEYVARGAAVALGPGTTTAGIEALLADDPARAEAGRALVARHLFDRGRSRCHVADVIQRVLQHRLGSKPNE